MTKVHFHPDSPALTFHLLARPPVLESVQSIQAASAAATQE